MTPLTPVFAVNSGSTDKKVVDRDATVGKNNAGK